MPGSTPMQPERSAEVAFAPMPQRLLVGTRSHEVTLELLSIPDSILPDNRVVVPVRSPEDFNDREPRAGGRPGSVGATGCWPSPWVEPCHSPYPR